MNEKDCIHLIDYINELLEEEEKEKFEEHLVQCTECQEQLAEFVQFNEEMGRLDDTIVPPTGMKQRILTEVFKEQNDETAAFPLIKKSKKQSRSLFQYAAAAVIIFSLGTNIYMMNQIGGLKEQVAETEKERDELVTIVEQFERTEEGIDQVIGVSALIDERSQQQIGTASILAKNAGLELVIQVEQLPALQNNEVYQVWVIQEGNPVPAGSFVTNERGQGAVTYLLADKNRLGEAIAISLEPRPNNEQPQGEVLVVTEL